MRARKFSQREYRFIRNSYVAGVVGIEVADKIGVYRNLIHIYFNIICLTRGELVRMHANLRALHNRYDKLHSFKSSEERQIENLATRICRRIDKQERRKSITG